MAQFWNVLDAFPEDSGSVPSTHNRWLPRDNRWLPRACNSSTYRPDTFFWPPWAPDLCHIYKDTGKTCPLPFVLLLGSITWRDVLSLKFPLLGTPAGFLSRTSLSFLQEIVSTWFADVMSLLLVISSFIFLPQLSWAPLGISAGCCKDLVWWYFAIYLLLNLFFKNCLLHA